MNRLSWPKCIGVVFALCMATAMAARAQTVTTLATFTYANGADPANQSLVQGLDGNLYGTTLYGGAYDTCATYGCGTVFKISPNGTLTTLHSFDGTDGFEVYGGLVQTTDGNFYGTASAGGTSPNCGGGCGTVFKITPGGTFTTLYSFAGSDGSGPTGPLVQARDGNFRGMTTSGGAYCAPYGCGTIFKITPLGALTTLYSFSGPDGSYPYNGLVEGADGNFYGETTLGGAYGTGTIFKITPWGALTTLFSFYGADGGLPTGGLIQATNGNLYGTTETGGTSPNCVGGCGTVFTITTGGSLTTLWNFDSTDGFIPFSGVIEGTDGNFYGTTVEGGDDYLCPGGCGTIFEITPGGTLTTVYSFLNFSDGSEPQRLAQDTDGNFYGTGADGGYDGTGIVFSLAMGLGPFVKSLPHSGTVGASIKILGTELTGTTSVSFEGTAAVFTVDSDTEISTIVPEDATTGRIRVGTPGGVLLSSGPFLVIRE